MNTQSRSVLGVVFLIVGLLICLILTVWLVPTVLRQLSPAQQALETIEEELGAHLNPTPTIRPDPTTIIRQVRALSRLETAFYTVEQVVTAESGQDALAFLFGDRLLLVAHGQIVAGVDLGRIGDGDITVTADDRVMLVLPPAEIFLVALDSQGTYVYDRDTGLLGMNPDLEAEARRVAEEQVLNAALEDGILEMADANARAYLEQLITAFGFQEVVFIQATPTPTPPLLPVTIVPATTSP